MAKESSKGRVPNTPRTTESPASSEAVAENDNGHPPFSVVLLRDLKSTPKKGGKKGAKGADHTAAKHEPLIDTDDDPAVYAITPGTNWESMRKYKNFVGMNLVLLSATFTWLTVKFKLAKPRSAQTSTSISIAEPAVRPRTDGSHVFWKCAPRMRTMFT